MGIVSDDVSRVSPNDVRVARDHSVKDNQQGSTNPPRIRERKRLREHTDAKQQGGGIKKLAKHCELGRQNAKHGRLRSG